jgi:hypothetical protein
VVLPDLAVEAFALPSYGLLFGLGGIVAALSDAPTQPSREGQSPVPLGHNQPTQPLDASDRPHRGSPRHKQM